MMDTNKNFYLGRLVDPLQKQVFGGPLLYRPEDLTTHAVVVGMTGSGKTGLCINLLEEAALQGFPALLIDLKGDIANILLHFPDLSPQDFQPWVNADYARREGKSIEQAAADTATAWRNGLAEWGIPAERIRDLQAAACFAVYTPGSDAGIPVSILTSLKAPQIPWEGNRELLREKIASTVTALLSLVGLQNIDPVRSREHILLANILENAWKGGKDLELSEIILQTQTPPFSRLGVFDVNQFFPERDRFELAMVLNNILAAPAFQSWIEGQPLDIPSLLYAADGRPRHSVFYLAHLTDEERMFFLALLLSTLESWMRTQTGIASLRAILFIDEIFGYLPPVGNPSTKPVLLRLLKQARAFGVSLVLATQNPMDMDYKALSNIGSWFIGKLQTENDKVRLLEGLESASSGGLARAEYDRMISGLDKRLFLLHNVHEKHPLLFQTRWAINYLAGPLSRPQIPLLNQLVGARWRAGTGDAENLGVSDIPIPVPVPGQKSVSADVVSTEPASVEASPESQEKLSEFTTTHPTPPAGVAEYYLPNNLSFTEAFQAVGRSYPAEALSLGLVYRPYLLAQASARFLNRKYNLDYILQEAVSIPEPDRRGLVRWEEFLTNPVRQDHLENEPVPQSRYLPLEVPFSDGKLMSALQKDFLDWVYRQSKVAVRANEALEVYAGPEVSQAEFRTRISEAAHEKLDAEIREINDKYEKQIEALQDKMAREHRELSGDQTELAQRKAEEMGAHAENILSLFSRRRTRLTTSLTKRRLTEQAKSDVEESLDAIEDYQKRITELQREQSLALEETKSQLSEVANDITEIPISAYRKDVLLDLFGIAWMPYYLVQIGEAIEELPGYSPD